MKKITKTIILAAAVAALAALLLAGCHEGNRNGHPPQKENEIQTAVSVDTSALDEGLYAPSPKIDAFHPDSLMGSWQWLHTYGYLGNLNLSTERLC